MTKSAFIHSCRGRDANVSNQNLQAETALVSVARDRTSHRIAFSPLLVT
jgi:hypothetical protein